MRIPLKRLHEPELKPFKDHLLITAQSKAVPVVPKPVMKKATYTKEFLEKQSFKALRKLGKRIGVKDRSRKKLIKEILQAQENDS